MPFDWVYALVGFAIMFGMLAGIGINQPRGTSVKTWCYGYLGISVGFDLLVVVALICSPQLGWLNSVKSKISSCNNSVFAGRISYFRRR